MGVGGEICFVGQSRAQKTEGPCSHSTGLPAFAGSLTAPAIRWCLSARPTPPSTAASTALLVPSSPRTATTRSATAAIVSGPPEDAQHRPAHVRVPAALRAAGMPHLDRVHGAIRIELPGHRVQGGKVRVQLLDARLRRF